jgi:tetratricopeptide (TPR) repeat protein
MAASRRAEEATLWQRAAASHERAGDRAAAFRSRCAGVKAVMAARPLAEAQVMTERLLAEAQGDAERLDALLERSTLLLLQHDTTPAEVAAGEALELARRLGLPWHEFHAARSLALALAQRKRGAEGVALLGRFEAVVEADGSLPYRFAYWSDMAYVLNDANRRREAARAWQSAAEIALAIGDRHEAVTCTSNLAIMLAQLGRPGEAHEHAQRAQRLQADLGHADDVVASAADMNVASFGLLLGHYGQALALFESALRRFRQSNAAAWIAACEHNLASTWLQLGQIARAMQALTPIDPAVPPTTRARRLVIEGRIERVLRRTALPRLRQALALIGERGDPFQRVLAELDESRELEPAAAIAQCRRCADRAGELELLGGAMKARLFELEALLRAGEGAAAAGLARETRERLADCRPVDMHWAEVLWLLSQAFDAGGDATRALEALDEAVHWIRLEALPHVPEPFRDAFLHRQPVNVAVLAAAGRRLPARGSSSAPR